MRNTGRKTLEGGSIDAVDERADGRAVERAVEREIVAQQFDLSHRVIPHSGLRTEQRTQGSNSDAHAPARLGRHLDSEGVCTHKMGYDPHRLGGKHVNQLQK